MNTLWTVLAVVHVCCQAVSSISPKMAEANANDALRVTCNANEKKPLDQCIFRVWLENDTGESPETELLDFSKGLDSPVLVRKRENNDVNFKGAYTGDGLKFGHCGVTLSELTEGRYFVGCRVRQPEGEWSYDFMALVVHSSGNKVEKEGSSPFLNKTVEPTKNSSAFDFTASDNIQDCKLFLPEQSPFDLTRNDRKTTGSYEGTIVGRKCSVTLFTVTLRSSGAIWALYRLAGETGWKAFPPQIINVKATPGLGTLTRGNGDSGEKFVVTCAVPPGRPAARLRWIDNGNVVREDDASAADAWAWPWDSQPVTQRLALDGNVDHNVECHVFYPDFNTEVQPVSTLNISKMVTPVAPATAPPKTSTPSATDNAVGKTGSNEMSPTAPADGQRDGDSGGLTWLWFILGIGCIAALGGGGYWCFKNKDELHNRITKRSSDNGSSARIPEQGEGEEVPLDKARV